MENKGLLFIPDISGFSRFINQTEINHSRLIIQELLELIISTNQIELEVSEIEGDAILFYKFGKAPDLQELYGQVEKMFCEFHRSLLAYDLRRYCQCTACISAKDLTLKIITHYGEFTGYNVRSFNKLIGKDVIVAHQLLKNDIEKHEYWLVTKSLLESIPAEMNSHTFEFTKMKSSSSAKQTETGEIPFQYLQLSSLKNDLKLEQLPAPEFSKKAKMFSVSKIYETDIITLFHATGDFNYRSKWLEGVKAVEEVNHFLPRVGMRCRCLLNNGEAVIYSSSYSYNNDRVEFTETDENKKTTTHFVLETIDNNSEIKKTKLTIDYYIEKDFIKEASFKLMKKNKIEESFKKSLENLTGLIKEIKLA